jgi:(E)-4-hydroxy-3-methylbut-2-enyl-diphosphate synthase
VDELFAEIDKSIDAGRVVVDEGKAAEGAAWLERIEEENADELTPERIAAMEAAAATGDALENGQSLPMAGAAKAKRIALDEDASPTAGRRFTRT